MRRPRDGGDPEYLLAFTRHILFVDSFGQQTRWALLLNVLGPGLKFSFREPLLLDRFPLEQKLVGDCLVTSYCDMVGFFTLDEIRVRQANDLCFLDRVPAARERWRSFPSCSCLSSSPCCWWSGTAFQVLHWHIFVLGSFWFNSFPWLGVTICASFATRAQSIILRQVLAWPQKSQTNILVCDLINFFLPIQPPSWCQQQPCRSCSSFNRLKPSLFLVGYLSAITLISLKYIVLEARSLWIYQFRWKFRSTVGRSKPIYHSSRFVALSVRHIQCPYVRSLSSVFLWKNSKTKPICFKSALMITWILLSVGCRH